MPSSETTGDVRTAPPAVLPLYAQLTVGLAPQSPPVPLYRLLRRSDWLGRPSRQRRSIRKTTKSLAQFGVALMSKLYLAGNMLGATMPVPRGMLQSIFRLGARGRTGRRGPRKPGPNRLASPNGERKIALGQPEKNPRLDPRLFQVGGRQSAAHRDMVITPVLNAPDVLRAWACSWACSARLKQATSDRHNTT